MPPGLRTTQANWTVNFISCCNIQLSFHLRQQKDYVGKKLLSMSSPEKMLRIKKLGFFRFSLVFNLSWDFSAPTLALEEAQSLSQLPLRAGNMNWTLHFPSAASNSIKFQDPTTPQPTLQFPVAISKPSSAFSPTENLPLRTFNQPLIKALLKIK